jgi:hypothetical protein
MPEEISHAQQGQNERAQRIRKQIEQLKSGRVPQDSPDKPPSLREQVEERAQDVKKKRSKK